MNKLTTKFSYDIVKNFKFTTGEQPCYTMIEDIIKFNGYSIGIAIMIPALNAALIVIIRGNFN